MNRREFLGSLAVSYVTSKSILAETNGQIINKQACYHDLIFNRHKINVDLKEKFFPVMESRFRKLHFVPMAVPDGPVMNYVKECEFAAHQDNPNDREFFTYVVYDNNKRVGIIVSTEELAYTGWGTWGF